MTTKGIAEKLKFAALVLAIATPLGGGVVAVWSFFIGKAEAAGAARAENVEKELGKHLASAKLLEDDYLAHKRGENEFHLHTDSELKEIQADTRALYRAVMTKQPQDRLEQPPGVTKDSDR